MISYRLNGAYRDVQISKTVSTNTPPYYYIWPLWTGGNTDGNLRAVSIPAKSCLGVKVWAFRVGFYPCTYVQTFLWIL